VKDGNPPASGPAGIPVQVQIRFERFPVSIKGAFVLKGGDGDPHAVTFDFARVARIPSGPSKPIFLEDRQLDVAPNRELFVPFEVPVSEMDPSWYTVESSVRVDGGRSYEHAGRPFTIPWPRSDVRKGTIQVGKTVRVGELSFPVERVELGWDSAAVLWRTPEGPQKGTARAGPDARAVLIADGTELEQLPDLAGSKLSEPRSAGEVRSVTYPVLRATHSLGVSVELASGEAGQPVALQLP
jgi:hypothetical protein